MVGSEGGGGVLPVIAPLATINPITPTVSSGGHVRIALFLTFHDERVDGRCRVNSVVHIFMKFETTFYEHLMNVWKAFTEY